MRLKDMGVSRRWSLPRLVVAPDDGRRVPLGEHGHVTQAGQPLAQQVYLGALAGTVDPLHDYQTSRIPPVVGMVAKPRSHGKVYVQV